MHSQCSESRTETEMIDPPQLVQKFTALAEPERIIITAADTFFIATTFHGDAANFVQAVDVSHRGGKPG